MRVDRSDDQTNVAFDPEAEMQQWAQGDKAITDMYLALQAAEAAKTTRELAHARVRLQEKIIRKMLASGVSQASILDGLVASMPLIPKKDLHAALEAIRNRILRERKKAEKNTEAPVTTKTAPIAMPGTRTEKAIAQPIRKPVEPTRPLQKVQPSPVSTGATVDESDRIPGESDEDYQLRISLEPKPDRRKFIGEGD